MKYPENSKILITKIVIGDIDSLGKGNNEFVPQSGLEIHYKIWTSVKNPETGKLTKSVVGSGVLGYPLFNEHVEFSEIESIINKDLKSKLTDLLISCEEIVFENCENLKTVQSIISV